MSKTDLGKRIRKFRDRLKISQADLAAQMGFNSSETVSQIERGDRDVKAWELAKLANSLSVSINDLLSVEKPEKDPAVLWRESPETQKDLKEAAFIKRCRQYALLEEMSEQKQVLVFPQKSIDPDKINFQMANEIALQIRGEFHLGGRPAGEIERVLQNVYGVKIWYLEMAEGSAASTIGPFGPAILMNASEAPWRRNYNFAHELFHLITWNSIPLSLVHQKPGFWDQLEKVANAFASSLILPAELLINEFGKHLKDGKISYTDFIEIARDFGVSTEALLYRLLNLGLLTKPTVNKVIKDPLFRDIDRSSMAPRWWQPPVFPERFVTLAFVAFQKGKLSRAKLSEMLDTSLFDLPGVLQEYGLTEHEGFDAQVRAA